MLCYQKIVSNGLITENRGEFIDKLQRARASVKNSVPQPILSKPGASKLIIGNWALSCKK